MILFDDVNWNYVNHFLKEYGEVAKPKLLGVHNVAIVSAHQFYLYVREKICLLLLLLLFIMIKLHSCTYTVHNKAFHYEKERR